MELLKKPIMNTVGYRNAIISLRNLLIGSLLTLIIFVVLAALFYTFLKQNHFIGKQGEIYNNIVPGMTLEQIKGITGIDPVHVCAFKSYTVVYFLDNRPFSSEGLPTLVEEINELPNIYDAIQLLFDNHGICKAVTWNGEALFIRTQTGNYNGANIAQLPIDYF